MSYFSQSDFPRELHQSINPFQAEFDRLIRQSLVRRSEGGVGIGRAGAGTRNDESVEIVPKEGA